MDYSNRSPVSFKPTIFKTHGSLFAGRAINANDLYKGTADINNSKTFDD
jgi:hypothetical protein